MNDQQRRFVRIGCTALFLLISLWGCSGRDATEPRRDTVIDESRRLPLGGEGSSGAANGASSMREKLPWQIWVPYHDLTGSPVTNRFLLEGDQLFQQGAHREALKRYRSSKRLAKTKTERDSVIVREASALIVLGKAEEALRLLSDYFRNLGQGEDTVSAPFALLFAYGYGSRGDIDQSLAWFSRTNRMEAGLGGVHEAAEKGARSLLQLPSSADLLTLSERWKTDSFVRLLVGREFRRRNASDYTYLQFSPERFWEVGEGMRVRVGKSTEGPKTVVGVLLPLSGQHAPLGERTRRGIELAFLGQQAETDFVLDVRDTAGDPMRANTEYREILNRKEKSAQEDSESYSAVVLGPLLSEVASSVSGLASKTSVPMLTFSKSSRLVTGLGVFRLGPTLESQVSSLLEAAAHLKGLRRIIVVSPTGPAAELYRSAIEENVRRLGMQVVSEINFVRGDDESLVAAATEVEEIAADAIFFPGSLKDASRLVGNLSWRKREQIRMLGLGTWDDPRELMKSQSILDGALFVSPFYLDSEREVVQKFREAHENKYGTRPDFLAAQGFDAATLLIAATRQAQMLGLTAEEGLQNVQAYEGLTGRISVGPYGELHRVFQVLELDGGEARPAERMSSFRSSEESGSDIREQEQEVNPSYVYRGDERVEGQVE